MEAFLSTSLVDWRLETRFDANGDRIHRHSDRPVECWRPLKLLGNGTFGDVWQEHCVLGANKNTFRAVKQIRRLRAGFSALSKRELEALVAFSNPDVPAYRDHFVQFLGWFDDERDLYIAMEYMHFGDLQQYITCRSFPESEAASIASQVAHGLHYMHENSFVHRDIKPLNILVAEPGPRWRVKLADFGLAKCMDGTVLATQSIGTRGYMAPELVEESTTEYTSAVDIWALGAVVFCMRTRIPPFPSTRHLINYVHRQETQLITGPLTTSSGHCIDFVLGAMAAEASSRLTIRQVLAHNWLSMESKAEHHENAAESTMATDPWAQIDSNAWSSTLSSGSVATQSVAGSWSPRNPYMSSSSSIQHSGEGTPGSRSSRHPQPSGGASQPRPQGSPRYDQKERAGIYRGELAEKRDEELRNRLVFEFGYTEEEVEDILNKRYKKDRRHNKEEEQGKSDSLDVEGPKSLGTSSSSYLHTALPLRLSSIAARDVQYTEYTDPAMIVPRRRAPVPSEKSSRSQSKNPEPKFRGTPSGQAVSSSGAAKTSIRDSKPSVTNSGSRQKSAQKQDTAPETDDDLFLTCLTCKQSFHFRSDLLKHLETKQHARDPVTKEWRSYKRSGRPSNPKPKVISLKCSPCGEKFDCSHCYANHQEDSGHGKKTDNPFVNTCRTCDASFDSRDELSSHLREFGHARSSTDSLRTCRKCNQAFNCFKCLSSHLRSSGHGQE